MGLERVAQRPECDGTNLHCLAPQNGPLALPMNRFSIGKASKNNLLALVIFSSCPGFARSRFQEDASALLNCKTFKTTWRFYVALNGIVSSPCLIVLTMF